MFFKKTKWRQFCSSFLVFALVLTLLPVSAFALITGTGKEIRVRAEHSCVNSSGAYTQKLEDAEDEFGNIERKLSDSLITNFEENKINTYVYSPNMAENERDGSVIPYFLDNTGRKWELYKVSVANGRKVEAPGEQVELMSPSEIQSADELNDYIVDTSQIELTPGQSNYYFIWYAWKLAEGEPEEVTSYQVSYDLNLPADVTTVYPVTDYDINGLKMDIADGDGNKTQVEGDLRALAGSFYDAKPYTVSDFSSFNSGFGYADFLAFNIYDPKNYYDFIGWKANDGENLYDIGEKVTISELADSEKEIIFTAQWKPIQPLDDDALAAAAQEISLDGFVSSDEIDKDVLIVQSVGETMDKTDENVFLAKDEIIRYLVSAHVNSALTQVPDSGGMTFQSSFAEFTYQVSIDSKLEFANVGQDGNVTIVFDASPDALHGFAPVILKSGEETNIPYAVVTNTGEGVYTITFNPEKVPKKRDGSMLIELHLQWNNHTVSKTDTGADFSIRELDFKIKSDATWTEKDTVKTSANIIGGFNMRNKVSQPRAYYMTASSRLTSSWEGWKEYFVEGKESGSYPTAFVHAVQFMDYELNNIDLKSDTSAKLNANTVTATYPNTVTITPADITVYTGGEGYTGVVDGTGQTTTTENGLPEPGYYITLPDWLNDELGGTDNAEELSDNLVLTYNDGNGIEKEWNLALYGTAAHSTDVANVETARYIYRIVPKEGTDNIPVRLQLTDYETGEVITNDEFTPDSDEQYKAYKMLIYTDEVTADKVTAKITVNGQTYTCKVDGIEGKLVVRGLTADNATTEIAENENAVSGSKISAVAPADVTYYVNGSKVEVAGTGGVKLLVDDVLSDGVLAEYIEKNMDGIPDGNYTYEEKYLDLVDTKNGNAYLTLDEGQKMTMYWPVPSGMNTGKDYYIVHFEALDRNYDNMNDELEKIPPATVPGATLVTVNGTQYIKFETDSFSPFVLVYEKKSSGSGGSGTTSYTITSSAGTGGSIAPSGKVSVTGGSDKTFTITAADGYEIADVQVDGKSVGAVSTYTFEKVSANHTISASFREKLAVADPDDTGVSDWLNTKDHKAYMNGYPDGSFAPDKNMTRAEAAQMFFNLLLDQNVESSAAFSDVPEDAWYAEAVNTLASLGMINGMGDGLYCPERSITRAEFTAMAMRFVKLPEGGENIFSDVSESDWFYDVVTGAVPYGWINGYPDGTFRPDNTITRAEVTTVVNRMLGRSADQTYVNEHIESLRNFTDVSGGYWAYYEIMEAANTHDYTKNDSGESWIG